MIDENDLNISLYKDYVERLNDKFLSEFEDVYKNLNTRGKSILIKNINVFYRKWYYSSLIDNTILSPDCILSNISSTFNIYSSVTSKYSARIGALYQNTLEYSMDNHPITKDFKLLANKVKDIIRINEDMKIDNALFEQLKSQISIKDDLYIEYLIKLGLELEIFVKMPSVGILAICLNDKNIDILQAEGKELLIELIDGAMYLAADNLTDKFMGESYEVDWEDVESWLTNPIPVDDIFTEIYGDDSMDFPQLANNLESIFDEFDKVITSCDYTKGSNIDKWFLTPFGYYFKLISPCYLYEYSYLEEMNYFITIYNEYIRHKDPDVLDAAIYSPCSVYNMTKLGAEIFGKDYKRSNDELFNISKPAEICEYFLTENVNKVKKLIKNIEPSYDIYTIKVIDLVDNKRWIDLEIKGQSNLEYFHLFLSAIISQRVNYYPDYRFYKEPLSPFTEYMPDYAETKGPKTSKTLISDLLELGEECFYTFQCYDNFDRDAYKIKLVLKKIEESKKNVVYPRVINTSKVLKEDKYFFSHT